MKKISLIIPVYHEEESLPFFFEKVNPILESLKNYNTELLFVCDYPDEGTYNLLVKRQEEQNNIKIVRLSRSFGHEEAVAAGMKVCDADACIPMDGDLQDDPEVIPQMVEKWEEGYDVVNGLRSSREEKGLSKLFVKSFYHFFNKWSKKLRIPKNVGDFRLLDRKVINAIVELQESTRVLKVEVPFVGFKTTFVEYERKNRAGGKTHYNRSAQFKNAFDYLTVSSDQLIMLIVKLNLCLFFLTTLSSVAEIVLYVLFRCDMFDYISPLGYGIWLIANILGVLTIIILFVLSLIGQYTFKAYNEARRRPNYIIESIKESKK